jgi:hypothetical protein
MFIQIENTIVCVWIFILYQATLNDQKVNWFTISLNNRELLLSQYGNFESFPGPLLFSLVVTTKLLVKSLEIISTSLQVNT